MISITFQWFISAICWSFFIIFLNNHYSSLQCPYYRYWILVNAFKSRLDFQENVKRCKFKILDRPYHSSSQWEYYVNNSLAFFIPRGILSMQFYIAIEGRFFKVLHFIFHSFFFVFYDFIILVFITSQIISSFFWTRKIFKISGYNEKHFIKFVDYVKGIEEHSQTLRTLRKILDFRFL